MAAVSQSSRLMVVAALNAPLFLIILALSLSPPEGFGRAGVVGREVGAREGGGAAHCSTVTWQHAHTHTHAALCLVLTFLKLFLLLFLNPDGVKNMFVPVLNPGQDHQNISLHQKKERDASHDHQNP